MKQALIPAAALLLFLSCRKTTSEVAAGISGKWNLLLDSTYDGVGAGNHAVTYHGKPGDSFDFGAGNNLAVSENGTTNTLKYTLYPDSKIVITAFGLTVNGIPDTSRITTLTPNFLVISSSFFPTPAGIYGRKVVLSR